MSWFKKMAKKDPTRILITGRSGSGKNTCMQLLADELRGEDYVFIELPSDIFLQHYKEEEVILYVNTPVILCAGRLRKSINLTFQKKEDQLLSYVTELPNCYIIDNNQTIDDLKVKIKKFVKNF